MPRPLGKLRILITSSALFDLREENEVWLKNPEAYKEMMFKNMDKPLKKGTAFELIKGLVALNKGLPEPLVEICLFSKNDAMTGQRIERSMQHYGMDFEMRSYVQGRGLRKEDIAAFGADMFLTTDARDAQFAIDQGVAAAVVNPPKKSYRSIDPKCLDLWFDGDAVAFGDSAERRYREAGLEDYKRLEMEDALKPVEAGPFTDFLRKLTALKREAASRHEFPIKIALLTARGGRAAQRAMNTIHALGIDFDEMHYMGGAAKRDFLAAHKPDFFFDDQLAHTEPGSEVVACGTVPYRKGSAMFKFMQDSARKKKTAEAKKAGKEITTAKTPAAAPRATAAAKKNRRQPK